MDKARGGLLPQRADHPLNLPPAAEVDDIAKLAASPGAAPRFRHGMVSETRNQLRGLGKRAAAGDVNIVPQNTPRLFL